MPELPEVETVRQGLLPVLAGRRIVRVEARRPDLRFPLPERFAERLTGRKVVQLARRAKYLTTRLDSGETLIMHLGMTGRFTVSKGRKAGTLGAYIYDTTQDARHDHVVFHLEGGGRLTYNDARRFGFMMLAKTETLDCHPLFKHLGPEPLGQDFTADYLAARAAGRKVDLKALLMDQRVVAGLGNIYVCEALFRAGLSPRRSAATLANRKGEPAPRTKALVEAIRHVLEDAIAAGGSTLRDYRHADGALGYFQHQFLVYGREGEPCVRPGCKGIVRRTIQAGRSSFHCPSCQR